MEFGFREPQRSYDSSSQRAKAWTEQWVADHLFCPNCGSATISHLPANLPVADFSCPQCSDQFELKSQKKPFGSKMANGAYAAKQQRLQSDTNPNLILLSYDLSQRSVRHVSVVPKHFFTLDIVEERKPLAPTARRAGWIGSNILLHRVPEAGRISVVRDGIAIPQREVLAAWQRTLFLRKESAVGRGWLIDVMNCVEGLGPREFGIEDVYAFEAYLGARYPDNNNVRPKIRQQLQVLRDAGFLQFLARGRYKLTAPATT